MSRYWRRIIFLIFFIYAALNSLSQTMDRNDISSAEISHPETKLDSSFNKISEQKDSLIRLSSDNVNEDFLSDFNLVKGDSLNKKLIHYTNQLQDDYQKRIDQLDSMKLILQRTLDSTTSILKANKITKSLDSINSLTQQATHRFQEKTQNLNAKVESLFGTEGLPAEIQKPLKDINQKASNVKNSFDRLTDVDNKVQLPGRNTPIETIQLGSDMSTQGRIINRVGEVPASGKTMDYGEIAQSVQKEISDIKTAPNAAEEKAIQFSRIRELKQQKKITEYSNISDKVKDQEAMKQEIKNQARKAATNHFADKEEQLKAAIDKMSEYKKKPSKLSQLAKKKDQAQEKIKADKFVPGISYQIQKSVDNLLIDFNPYVAYRFTKRISGGVGWNQRFGYDIENYRFKPDERIFGPRIFGEYRLKKGFSPRIEFETMNTKMPPLTSSFDPEDRHWAPGVFVGLKKEYKLFKNVKGTAIAMARLYHFNHRSPYADVINVRLGAEITWKKKAKKKGEG